MDKDLVIEWFESIRNILDKKFPTRFEERLEGQRGSEIDCVNEVIVKCKDCIEYIKEFM